MTSHFTYSFYFLFHYVFLQDIEYSFICYTIGLCLSILYIKQFDALFYIDIVA